MNKKAKIATIATLLLVALLVIGLVIAGPPKGKGKPACKDSQDNDGDGLIDYPADPGCDSPEDRDEYNEPVAYCGDGSCNGAETCETCTADCGVCPPVCGDGVCDSIENCSYCPSDCGVCVNETNSSG